MMPAYVELVASPVVSVLLPSVTVVPATPVKEPIVCDALSVRFAPDALNSTAPVLAMLPSITSEPALMVVAPL